MSANQTVNSSLHEKGAALLLSVIFFVLASTFIVAGIAGPVAKDIRTTRALIDSKASYMAAEGLGEDVGYRIIALMDYNSSESLQLGSSSVTASLGTSDPFLYVDSEARTDNAIRLVRTTIADGYHAGFDYGVHTDAGGISMDGSAEVFGNVFSNGPVRSLKPQPVGRNQVWGDVISAGPDGYVYKISATGTVWANEVDRTDADEEIRGEIVTNSTAGDGIEITTAVQATTAMPISDELLDYFKYVASTTEIYAGACPYVISSNTTLGPIRIPCDLVIQGATIDLTGVVWVEGDLDIDNNTTIRIDSGENNVILPIIADDESDRLSSSRIFLNNNSDFAGNGPNSYVLLVSRNESAATGGSVEAVEFSNGGDGELLLYVPFGEIAMTNSVSLSEVTSYQLSMENNTTVFFESGLQNLIIGTGNSGDFTFYRIEEVE